MAACDVLWTPDNFEKMFSPTIERFLSPPAFAARPWLDANLLETTRYERAELKCAAIFCCLL